MNAGGWRKMFVFLSLIGGVFFGSPLIGRSDEPASDKADTAFKQLSARLADDKGNKESLRLDLLAFCRTFPGTAQAVKAMDLVRDLPSPLDKLDPAKIPPLEKFDWQSKDLVAVLGDHRGHQGHMVYCVAFSPNGKFVASGGYYTGVRIWDPVTLRLKHTLSAGGYVYSMAFSRDSKLLATSGSEGAVRIFDMTQTPPKPRGVTKGSTSAVYGLTFSQDGKIVVAGGYDNILRMFNVAEEEPKELPALSGHAKSIAAIALSPDGKTLASAGGDGIRLWDFTLSPPKEKVHFQEAVAATCLAYAPNGNTLAAGCADSAIRFWNVTFAQPKEKVVKTPAGVTSLAYAAGGQMLASGGSDNIVRLWNAGPGTQRATLEGHAAGITGVAFSGDGRTLVSSSSDWTVRLWEPAGIKPGPRFVTRGHLSYPYAAAFSPDGKSLATGSEDRSLRLWDFNGPESRERFSLKGDNYQIYALAFTPDGKSVATCGNSIVSTLISLESRRVIRKFEGHAGAISSLDISNDGKHLITSSNDKTARIWDLKTGKEEFKLDKHESYVNSVVFSPTGKKAISAAGYYLYDKNGQIVYKNNVPIYVDCTVRLWDVDYGNELQVYKGHTAIVGKALVTPDGKYALSSGSDFTIRKWDLLTPPAETPPPFILSKSGHLSLLAMAPDGRTFITQGPTTSFTLWETITGKKLQEWTLQENLSRVAYSPDSRHLAVTLGTGVIYILRLAPPKT